MDYEYKDPQKLKLKKIKLEKAKDFHKITCPSCQNEVKATDLNINDKIAKCNECNVVFSFQEMINNLLTNPTKIKQEIIRPEGIDLFYFKEELDITVQQPYPTMQGALIFFVVLFSIMFTVAFLLEPTTFSTIAAPIFWLLSLYSFYKHKTHAKNKIHVSINERLLNIEWRPKKGNKNQSYDRNDIDQLYIGQGLGYEIRMIINGVDGQKHIRLIPGLDSISKARYLEQEIEKHLGIIDREVLEEVKV